MIIIRTIFTIITPLKVGVRIIHVNWSACQISFPEVTKRDQSTTWKSANSTRSVVGPCSCCLMLTVRTHQVSTAACGALINNNSIGPLDVLGTGMTVSCSPRPSRRLPPAGGRKRLYVQEAQQRCVDRNVSINAHICVHVCKLILSVCGGCERYLALSCGHL